MSDILLMIEIITSKIFVNGVLNVGTLKMHIMYGLGIPTNYTFNLGSYFWVIFMNNIFVYLDNHYYCPWLMLFPRNKNGMFAYYYTLYLSCPIRMYDNNFSLFSWLFLCLRHIVLGLTIPTFAFIFLVFSCYFSLRIFLFVIVAIYNLIIKICKILYKIINFIIKL